MAAEAGQQAGLAAAKPPHPLEPLVAQLQTAQEEVLRVASHAFADQMAARRNMTSAVAHQRVVGAALEQFEAACDRVEQVLVSIQDTERPTQLKSTPKLGPVATPQEAYGAYLGEMRLQVQRRDRIKSLLEDF